MKTIKGMFRVYWALFIYAGFILYLTIRQLICECLYLMPLGAMLLAIVTIAVFAYTDHRRKNVKE